MQEDALFATQTPREALDFSAALRLPKSVTPETRTKLVEEMLTNLGLTKCADTLIGSVMIPGISGGEKKRTAIGVELISNPDILFVRLPPSPPHTTHTHSVPLTHLPGACFAIHTAG